ncbi:MAG: CRISPR-associated endonuclease Cas1 [Coriobacteriaceae bacterium]|nr:CRISPR-associated endonuclease Cas1 [Coriobacteriaceae bacterium]
MKKLLNTLYIFTEDAYLSLNGENVVIWQNETKLGRIPLHTLESIISFSYKGASPALMGACAEKHISFLFSIVKDDSLQALSDPREET